MYAEEISVCKLFKSRGFLFSYCINDSRVQSALTMTTKGMNKSISSTVLLQLYSFMI